MTVQIANTELNSNFNSWRLNTNFMATVISNNVVTVSREGSANRGGVAKGNGHVSGTFSATELRALRIKSGNTTNDAAWIYINSNTSINATSLAITANTVFQGNVNFATSGSDRVVLGDISRIRVTGGAQGQFLRIEGESDTPNFKSLTLRDITDLSTNSAPIILSGANSTFSDNGDSVPLIFASGNERIELFLAKGSPSDLNVKLLDDAGDSHFVIKDSANTTVGYITSDGEAVFTANVVSAGLTTSANILPNTDDSVDLGAPNKEFRNAYIDGIAYVDELSMGTSAGQGVSTSLIPKTDAAGNLGSTTRKWGTVWADTTNGGAGVFNTLGVSDTLTVNGTATFNGGFSLTGDVDIGDAASDTLTITARVDSNVVPFDDDGTGQYDLGTTAKRWHNVYANNAFANNAVTDNNLTVGGDLTVQGSTSLASGQTFSSPIGRFSNVISTDTASFEGDTDIGTDGTDTVTINAVIDSNLIPSGSQNIGSGAAEWNNAFFTGTVKTDFLTVDENVSISGTVASGNTTITGSLDVSEEITNDGTVLFGSNSKLHANNTITDKTILTNMIANTMTSGSIHGGSSQIPVIRVNDRGQVIGISNTVVAGVTGLTYTQSNNNIKVSTATGTSYDSVINPATANTDGSNGGLTNRGVASFNSTQFNVTNGLVSIGSGTSAPVLEISGTSNEVNVSRVDNTVTVGLPDDVTIAGQLNVGENIVVSGNLIVQGTTTTVESETVRIHDNIIVLNSDESGTPSQDAGITVERGTSTDTSILWDESTDRWTFTNNGSNYYNIPISTEYDNYTSWTIQDGDSTTYTVTSGDTLQIAEGNGINSNFTGNDVLTITNTKPFDYIVVEDGDGTELNIANLKEWKFREGGGVDINWTDTSTGSDADPYDLSFTISSSITAGSGLSGGGQLNASRTISHADTSSLSGQYGGNNNGVVIEDITVDGFGHVTAVGTRDLDSRFDNYGSWTILEGNGSETSTIGSGQTLHIEQGTGIQVELTATRQLTVTNTDRGSSQNIFKRVSTNSGTATADNNNDILAIVGGTMMSTSASGDTITINHADTSSQGSVNNSNGTVIQDISLDSRGHITNINSVNLDGRYYTEDEANSRFCNIYSGSEGVYRRLINNVDLPFPGSQSSGASSALSQNYSFKMFTSKEAYNPDNFLVSTRLADQYWSGGSDIRHAQWIRYKLIVRHQSGTSQGQGNGTYFQFQYVNVRLGSGYAWEDNIRTQVWTSGTGSGSAVSTDSMSYVGSFLLGGSRGIGT